MPASLYLFCSFSLSVLFALFLPLLHESPFISFAFLVMGYAAFLSVSGGVPEEVGQCKSLRKLWLHDNRFPSGFSGELPASLSELQDLRELYVYSNLLCGKLPSELGFLGSLRKLYLFNNQFVGDLPSTYGQASWQIQSQLSI